MLIPVVQENCENSQSIKIGPWNRKYQQVTTYSLNWASHHVPSSVIVCSSSIAEPWYLCDNDVDVLMQEWRNSSALAMELRLSCMNVQPIDMT